jgi:hypothetical protein
MLTIPRVARLEVPAVVCVLLTFAALAWTVDATAAVRSYEAQVPLEGTTAEDRNAGFASALRVVAVKASGRRDAASNATVVAADPTRLVQRYSTTAEKMLKVGFDAQALEDLLQRAGLPLWPAERPVTQIDAPVADRAEAERAADQRGLPIAWVTAGVSAATGAAATSGAVGAKGPRAVLTGVPDGTEFAWSFSHAGRSVEARGSTQAGIDLAADTLAARYATPATRSSSSVSLRVGGIDGLASYAGLLGYLESLSLVRGVEVATLEGSVVELRLTVRGDRELLDRIFALDAKLEPETTRATPEAAREAAPGAPLDASTDGAGDVAEGSLSADASAATGPVARPVDFVYVP